MPQLKRFEASSLALVYEAIRDELGDEAVIVSTRVGKRPALFGLRQKEFVEVVAHVPDAAVESVPFAQDAAAHDLVRGVAEAAATGQHLDVRLPSEPLPSIPRPAAAEADGGGADSGEGDGLAPSFVNELAGAGLTDRSVAEQLAEGGQGPFESLNLSRQMATQMADSASEVASAIRREALARAQEAQLDSIEDDAVEAPRATLDHAQLDDMAAHLAEVREMVERLAVERTNSRVDEGPAGVHEARSRLIDQGVSMNVMLPVLDSLAESVSRDADTGSILRTVARKLVTQLPSPAHLNFSRPPVTVFLVGPSGAGKTTFAMRLGMELASTYSLSVTVAGTDVTRVGAPQQLQAFGAATELPVRLCYTPGELQALIDERAADVVIVDTPGNNGDQRGRMSELEAFLQPVRKRSMLLVLPATMKSADIERVMQHYRALKPDGLVFTRCDETKSFGALLTAAAETRIGVAYTTHSDSVTDELRLGDNHALATAVMLGRWPAPLSASRPRTARPSQSAPALARTG